MLHSLQEFQVSHWTIVVLVLDEGLIIVIDSITIIKTFIIKGKYSFEGKYSVLLWAIVYNT